MAILSMKYEVSIEVEFENIIDELLPLKLGKYKYNILC